MSKIPKIRFDDLKRTNLGFPSQWKVDNVKIEFRYGIVTIFVDDRKELETERYWVPDDLDGFMSDEDLKKVLAKHELLS